MQFRAFTLLVVSLSVLVSGQATDERLHVRDFSPQVRTALGSDRQLVNVPELTKRNDPTIPAGKDKTKLHVWVRLDTRPTTYDDRMGANHEGLNQLMHDTGGRHVDLVIGNESGFKETGLEFTDSSWLSKPNGDGAAVESYFTTYAASPGQALTYKGQLDGRMTLNSIKSKGESQY
jgi:hypothetical protein